MKCLSRRFILEEARPEDSDEILSILEESGFDGNLSLICTRRPDPVASILREGDNVLTLVSRDLRQHCVAGMGAIAVRKAFVRGKTVKVGYLFGLRLRKECKGAASLIPDGYRLIGDYAGTHGVRYVSTAILEENLYARKLLEKKRRLMPDYVPVGNYEVHSISTNYASRFRTGDFVVRRCSQADTEDIVGLISDFAGTRDFYPCLNRQDLFENRYQGLTPDRFVGVWNRKKEIIACGALWDQSAFKQYYVKKYGTRFAILAKAPFVMRLLGYPPLPAQGSRLRFGTLSFWAVRGYDPEPFRVLLGEAARLWNDLSFIAVGMHEKEPFLAALRNMRAIRYRSRIYLVDWKKDGDLSGYPDGDSIPFFDPGLL